MKGIRGVTLSFLLCLCAFTAYADEVVLNSGGTMKGTVVSRNDEFLVLATEYGTVTFATSDIAEVREASPEEKRILAKLAALDPADIPPRLKLAKSAASADLDDLARKIYSQVIALDPDEKNARRALGYIKFEGEWVTPADKLRHRGLVPYKGRWMTTTERDRLMATNNEQLYYAEFSLTPSEGREVLDAVNDLKLEIEPRGGFIVRRHINTYPVKDKPYMYSVDLLTWKRLGVFISVSFIDDTRHKVPAFGRLSYKVFSVAVDTVGNPRPDKEILSETLAVTPEMWEKKSDLKYWDTRINHSSYDKIPSDETRRMWHENFVFNYDGILYILANRDIALLAPPGVYYIEATFHLKDKERKVGRYVQYADAR